MSISCSVKKRPTTVTRPYGGVQAQARRTERQQRLLRAGAMVFGEKGFYQATIRDVCDTAGLTERYFYESFKTLKALFVAVQAHMRDALTLAIVTQASASLNPSPSPLDALSHRLNAWYEFLKADTDRARILLIEACIMDALSPQETEVPSPEFHARVLRIAEVLPHPQYLNLGDHHSMAIALTGTLMSLARNWLQNPELPQAQQIEQSLVVFRGLAALHDHRVSTDRFTTASKQAA